MTDIPAPLTYGTVTGSFYEILPDSADGGVAPDFTPLNGVLSIVPNVNVFQVISGSQAGSLITQATPFVGKIVNGAVFAADGVSPFTLLATDSPGIQPTPFQYTASFTLTTGQTVDPVTFNLAGGTTVSLTSIVSVPASPPIVTVYSTTPTPGVYEPAGLSDETKDELNNTFAPKTQVFAADFGVAASTADNKSNLQAAVNAAVAAGAPLVLPQGVLHVAGTVNCTASVNIIGAGRGVTFIHQDTKPTCIFYVTGTDVHFSDFTVEGNDLDMTGFPLNTTSENTFQNYVGIRALPTAHGLRVERVNGHLIYLVVMVRDTLQTVQPQPTKMQRAFFSDIETDGCWGALHGGPFLSVKADNIRGNFKKAFGTPSAGDTGQKPHLVYLSTSAAIDTTAPGGAWDDNWRSKGGEITNISGYDCSDVGAVLALKYTDGAVVNGVTARNTKGVLDLQDVGASVITGVADQDDALLNTGLDAAYAAIYFNGSHNVQITAPVVNMAVGSSGVAILFDSQTLDSTVRGGRITENRTTADTVGNAIVVKGIGNTADSVEVVNNGAAANAAFQLVQTGQQGRVISPRVSGLYKYSVDNNTGHAQAFIDYDPALVAASRSVAGAAIIRVVAGLTPTIRDRSLGQPVAKGFIDLFDRPDNIGLVATDDGKAWVVNDVTTNASGWKIATNAGQYNGGSIRSIVKADGGSTNGTITATVGNIGTAVGGIAVRVQDANNYVGLVYRAASGDNRLMLIKRVAGTQSVIATAAAGSVSANGSVIAVVMAGDSISVTLNGTQVIAPQTIADFDTLTTHGLLGDSSDLTVTVLSVQFVAA